MSFNTQAKRLYPSFNIYLMHPLSWILEMLLKVWLGQRKSEFLLSQIQDHDKYLLNNESQQFLYDILLMGNGRFKTINGRFNIYPTIKHFDQYS